MDSVRESNRLTCRGYYTRVTGCPFLSMVEAQELLKTATGVSFTEEQICIENNGFLVALEGDVVGHLLNKCLQNLKDDHGDNVRVKFRDPAALEQLIAKKHEQFTPPAEWLQQGAD